jgi:diguanylate cyclase (GGDEF)-like protein
VEQSLGPRQTRRIVNTDDASDERAPTAPHGAQDKTVLDALVRLASLITSSPAATDLIETVAETTCELLGASSVSISRLEDDRSTLRTLINVGSLGPGEQRRPAHETYRLADFPDSLACLVGQPVRRAVTDVDDPQAEPAEVALLRSLGKSSSLKTPIILDARVWGELWATRASSAPPFNDHDADMAKVIVALVSAGLAQAAAWQTMQQRALTDPLTGLYNRHFLEESFKRELIIAERAGHPVSVIMGDLDHFKTVNDRDGHLAGDEVLRVFGALLTNNARASDISCRYGGEEFLLVLPGLTQEGAAARAEHLRRAMSATPVDYGGSQITVTVSFGVATYPTHGRTPLELIAAADSALYSAKAQGRNRVNLCSESGPD